MRTSQKDRRSERVPAAHRLLMRILAPSGAEVLKEIVTAVEVSQNGARIRGRRTLQPDWTGVLVQLASGRQAPFRIAWQAKTSPEGPYLESGIEILASFNFWGRAFSDPDHEPTTTEISIEDTALSPEEFLQELGKAAAFDTEVNGRFLVTAWCGLVEQLEERKVVTRSELAASIRTICGKIDS